MKTSLSLTFKKADHDEVKRVLEESGVKNFDTSFPTTEDVEISVNNISRHDAGNIKLAADLIQFLKDDASPVVCVIG